MIKSSFHQLLLLAKVKPYLSFDDLERVIHVFMQLFIHCSWSVLPLSPADSAERCRSLSDWREHITPVLVSLHWLTVHFRIHFKVLIQSEPSGHQMSCCLRSQDPGLKLRATERSQWLLQSYGIACCFILDMLYLLESFKSSLKTHFFLLGLWSSWSCCEPNLIFPGVSCIVLCVMGLANCCIYFFLILWYFNFMVATFINICVSILWYTPVV